MRRVKNVTVNIATVTANKQTEAHSHTDTRAHTLTHTQTQSRSVVASGQCRAVLFAFFKIYKNNKKQETTKRKTITTHRENNNKSNTRKSVKRIFIVICIFAVLFANFAAQEAPSTVTSSCSCYSSFLHSSHSSGRLDRDSSKTAAVDTNNTLRSSATVKATTTATTTATLPSQTSTSTPLPPPLSLPPLTICQPQAPTPPYQRLTKALQCDPRCGHEVTIGRRIGLYRFCGDIGRGNFSKVKLAVHQLTRDKVAIKVVDLDRAGLDAKALRMLSSEIATLECVHHPNILRLFEVVETLGRVYLVTEWVRGGELYNHITQGGPLREIHAAPLFKQLLLAVKHMHSLGYVHRDIKAENVLLLSEDRLKLADFGFSTQLINGPNQKLDTFCGSPPYAAPELFSDDHYIGAPVDVWALGILLYFMVVGNMPFRAPTIPGLKAAILKGDYLLPGQLSLPCIRLIQRILIHVPAQRPTIDDMLNSQFVTCPKLSAELMQQELNLHSKPTKRSIFWARKSHRLRKTASLRERYTEVVKKPAISMNTRQQDEMFVHSFLHPIELNPEPAVVNGKEQEANGGGEPTKRSGPGRRYLFCGTLKKKITPIETEPEKQLSNGGPASTKLSPWSVEVAEDCPLFKNYDAVTGSCIMLPTNTDDLSQLCALEFETRQILAELGVSSEMLIQARQSGPRSDIIGAYRIVLNRLQKQSWLARKHVEMALHLEPKQEKRIERQCCIL